jgi:hypothetical protein
MVLFASMVFDSKIVSISRGIKGKNRQTMGHPGVTQRKKKG